MLEYPVPVTQKELESFVGLAVYYSKWIPKFADVTAPLFEAKKNKVLPHSKEALESFNAVKRAVANATLWIPGRQEPFTLETDASGIAIGGVLCQNGRPVALFSQVERKRTQLVGNRERSLCHCVVYPEITSIFTGFTFHFTYRSTGCFLFLMLHQSPQSKITSIVLHLWRDLTKTDCNFRTIVIKQ